LESGPPRQLLNAYGPTECTTFTTTYRVETLDEDTTRIPIGKPIANTKVYILDPQLQPVPIGVVGEIYIGGAGVARGYLNRPELTAERFLPDPFSRGPQARMYKSGDLGRWQADGNVEFLGRNDDQVKIRGFRIELGEIEAQLTRHASVREAAILAREDVPGEKRLVAYVMPQGESAPNVESLRAHLKALLPEYMVPSAFVTLERLPLTPNGKLDRKALPAPELDAYVTRQYEPPQGEVEEILAGIWQELLKLERVGRHDNFFELGGHSLLIVQVMERLRRGGLSTEVRRVFESPTLADLARALTREAIGHVEVPPNRIPADCEAITPEMLPLIELEAEHIARIVQSVPGGARNIQDLYPLTPLQEGMLFHHLLSGADRDAYARSTLLSLPSREALERFTAALQQVIDRHDVLRTAVLWEQLPQPVQVVHRRATLPVEEFALNSDRDPVEELKERMAPEHQRLDLRQAPLMRLHVAADPRGTQWYALLQTHHLVFDNESLDTLLAEVKVHVEGHVEALPAPRPYRTHVAQALAHACPHDAEAFFRGKLGDIDEPTAPFGLLEVHGDGSRTEEAHRALDPALSQRVRAQARCLAVSAATLFHAAWALVVARTSGRDDIVYGSVLSGRLQGAAGAQRILGMFINTLPLRLRLREVTARELVLQTQRELVELLSHEQASLAVAQRCSGIEGSAPLFTTLLNYLHRAEDFESQLRSTAGVSLLASQGGTNYPITLSVHDLGEGFALTVTGDRPVDPHRVVDYMSTATLSLVEALEGASQTLALSLAILPEPERHEVIEAFNATAAPYRQDKLLHELFEAQAERTPQTVAVMHEGQSLTYAELNSRANRLARYMRAQGVGPGRPVGLCVDRSVDLVVGMLAIWKAGGAYVPLDPDYPAERLGAVLGDAAPSMVLTQEQLHGKLPPTMAEVVSLDTQRNEIARSSAGNLDPRSFGMRSDHLAYVIYTSGSTGQPKGVMVEHRHVASLWQSLEHLYRQSAPCERIGVNASFSFDASVKQFIQLLSGRTLVLVPQEMRWDAPALLRFIEAQRIDGIDCTPAQLRTWIDAGLLEQGAYRLRMVLVGGEPIEAALWNTLTQCTGTDFYNVYGPTESTVDTTAARVNGDASTPHIGRPMENRQVYLLDSHDQPVPIGVIGEIHIGGAGVARGYLNCPELTGQRFIRDPFSADPQARMYKTGDLGRWRPDGTIEFLGRNDQQVKIRGFRIELGEIEAQLTRHSEVREAVVLAREDVPGEKRLVAYVTLQGESAPSVESLREHLKALLPEYMVPSAFVTLERLPLTPNGKLDRKALPAPELDAYVTRRYEPPQGEVEEILAGIWQELLKVERVGRHDNFFELGGHSLLAMRALSRVRQRLNIDLPIKALFDAPVLEALAVRLKADQDTQALQEALRRSDLARDLRRDIDELDDDTVLARIAALERELSPERVSGQANSGLSTSR
jgi:amino acid adenylation domain-containing protein